MLDVLVVDDSNLIRRMIIKTLELADVPMGETYEAGDGREALDIMEHKWVDLVLADINMPVMDGVEMVGHMRRSPGLAGVPVIVVSTEGSTERMSELSDLGVSAYIRKPFTPEALRDVVSSATYEWGSDEHVERPESLEDVVRTVLERFTFMWGEVLDMSDVPVPQGELLVARITVSGAVRGEMGLAAPLSLCSEMAANVLGEDPAPEVATEAAADALGEALNMVPGHVATALSLGAATGLEPPVVTRLSSEDWRRMLDGAGTVAFVAEDRPVLLRLGLRSVDPDA